MNFGQLLRCTLLLLFCLSTFHWEMEQLWMWKAMVETNAAELGMVAATQKALSGEAPCDKCKSLAKEILSEDSDESFSAPWDFHSDPYGFYESHALFHPGGRFISIGVPPLLAFSRRKDPPALPPV